MDPNSQNQIWSKWVWFVEPRGLMRVDHADFARVQHNVLRFARRAFGSVGQMRISQTGRGYIVEVIAEGHPVGDKIFQDAMKSSWERFFKAGFGQDTTVKMTAKLMAGKRPDGKPPDQMLILPTLEVNNG